MDVLAWTWIDDDEIVLREREVGDFGHGWRVERAGNPAGLDHAVRVMLGVQSQPRLVDVEDHLPVLVTDGGFRPDGSFRPLTLNASRFGPLVNRS